MDAYLGYYSELPDLEKAMADNQNMRLLMAGGIYDLATPWSATVQLMNHSSIPRERLTLHSFPAGHSIFDNADQLPPLAAAVRRFITTN